MAKVVPAVVGVLAVLAAGALVLIAPWLYLAATMGPDSPDSPPAGYAPSSTYAPAVPAVPSPTTASPSRFPAPLESPAPPVSLDR
ncbi:hypothetical protein GCM10018790_34160 [Kitasatospora xanthocidica]|nr:hypothetical protein GCM10018790_34160 [Kitasatospora xanthocidica]